MSEQYGGHPQYQPPQYQQPQYPPAQPSRPAPNPLGLASLIAGALVPLLGLVFVLLQAAVFRSGAPADALGVLSAVQSVLAGILGIAAVVLGIVAITRPGLSKIFAAAGIALGASALVGVISTILYTASLQLLYSY